MWKVQYLRVKIVCLPPKRGILAEKGSVFYAQSVCLFYGLCVFTIVFSLFWMALPKLPLSQTPAGSETDPASPLSLAAQAVPQTDAARYCLRDSGGRVAVYTCRADGTPGTLIRVTGIYRELDLLLEDLGE